MAGPNQETTTNAAASQHRVMVIIEDGRTFVSGGADLQKCRVVQWYCAPFYPRSLACSNENGS